VFELIIVFIITRFSAAPCSGIDYTDLHGLLDVWISDVSRDIIFPSTFLWLSSAPFGIPYQLLETLFR